MANAMAAAPEFVMHGARAALSDGLGHVEEQVKGIERAVVENPGLAFDLARTLVESTCRTILAERKQSFTSGDDLPKLFKAVTTFLPLLPAAASGDGTARRSLTQTLNGLHTTLQGVCELRNACGFASHGASGPRPPLETVQAMLAAQAADAIVGFLHAAHRQDHLVPKAIPLRYGDNDEFNEYVDDEHGDIRIFELTFRPSEVLFQLDPQGYRAALADYRALSVEEDVPAPSTPTGDGP